MKATPTLVPASARLPERVSAATVPIDAFKGSDMLTITCAAARRMVATVISRGGSIERDARTIRGLCQTAAAWSPTDVATPPTTRYC